jgi:hypothetical protein
MEHDDALYLLEYYEINQHPITDRTMITISNDDALYLLEYYEINQHPITDRTMITISNGA